jgi:hypothetical protein
MRIRARIATLVTSSLLLAASAAGAQTITVPGNGATVNCSNPANSNPFYCGQWFTAPAGASLLQSFSFTLRTPSSLTFELYAFASPNVLGPALFTQALDPTPGDAYATLVFAPAGGIAVVEGASYAAVVRMEIGESVWLLANSTSPYAGGSSIVCDPGAAPTECFDLEDYDAAFAATFGVAQTPVPEPATLALTGGGLLLMGAAVRRRRRAAM